MTRECSTPPHTAVPRVPAAPCVPAAPLRSARAGRFPIALLSLAAATVLPRLAHAAQTDITISTAPAPATPRINGPTVLGVIPGSPFLHTVSATGQAPLKFSAAGLPSGLTIDESSGTLSGTAPAAGSYTVNLTVTNSAGSASGSLKLMAGSTLALTPPLGWNSYDSFGANVKESDVKAAAQAMKTLLQPYGWNTIVIDYLWYDSEQTIDANGRWLPSSSKYPSATGANGFKPLADQVHGLGLGFGIHLMRGIPRKSVTADSPIADSTSTASQAGNTGDTCSWDSHMYGVRADSAAGKAWYDSIYSQYASWGVDFVKVDDMMNPYGGNVLHTAEVQAVHDAIAKTGRSMILSLSPGPNQPKDVAVLNANANMWRTVNDFWDTNGLSSLSDEFTAAYNWSKTSGITPGHWPDADMLPLGTIGSRACAFSHNQQVTVMTLWAIMPSPLMFGGQMTKLASDSWTLALLTNEEVLAINQDALGNRATRVSQQNDTEIWARDLADGRKAVALFNRGTQDAVLSVTFSQLGVTGSPPVRDVWHRQDATATSSGISVNVPHEGALLYVVGTASGAGGSGGADAGSDGGRGGTGGTVGDGGAGGSGVGGSGAGGSTSGSGGRSGAKSGAFGTGGGANDAGDARNGPGAGGRAGAGGATGAVSGSAGATIKGTGGTATPGGSGATPNGAGGAPDAAHGAADGVENAPSSSSGCSCSLASFETHSAWSWLLFGAAAMAGRCRRREARRGSARGEPTS